MGRTIEEGACHCGHLRERAHTHIPADSLNVPRLLRDVRAALSNLVHFKNAGFPVSHLEILTPWV